VARPGIGAVDIMKLKGAGLYTVAVGLSLVEDGLWLLTRVVCSPHYQEELGEDQGLQRG
jgi:hypothetical protein